MNEKKRLLFVCMGNICRSPAAEGIMQSKIKEAGLEDSITCDSAGTIGFHAGNPADSRMRSTAKKRKYLLQSISRAISTEDLENFDLILTMDEENLSNVRNLDPEDKYTNKIVPMCSFCTRHDVTAVPDPYYGGDKGFEIVLDILEDACEGLLDHLKKEMIR